MVREYVISDLHFGHKNIIKFERTEFTTIAEHDAYIAKCWNEIVKPNDKVYILGDVGGFWRTDLQYMIDLIKSLNGYKILIFGNHDTWPRNKFKEFGFQEAMKGPIFIRNGKVILSHEPAREAFNNPYAINIHGHLHNRNLLLDNYYCVSAKYIDYKPVLIDSFLKEISKCKNRREKFGEEWYYEFYDNKENTYLEE